MNSRLGWKVPFRQVYCDTFWTWVRAIIWCHFVLRLFPNAVEVFDMPYFEPADPPPPSSR